MNYPEDVNKLHVEIQKKIFFMIPEKWERLYLYASVVDRLNEFKTGEMFFYYFPKGILKKRPINVYEIPNKFNIDEFQYSKYTNALYNTIKKLRHNWMKNKSKPWSNITIIIENSKYRVIYGYEDLTDDILSIEERRVIWLYRYLKLPYASFHKKEKELISKYGNIDNENTSEFEMPIDLSILSKELDTIKNIQEKFEYVTEDTIQEMEFKKNHVPKSQILNLK